MEMIVKKWGNSLAARIPKAIADMIDLKFNQKINIEAKKGQIIITPVTKVEYDLDELLDQCTKNQFNLTEEDDAWVNAEPVGKEW